MKAAIYYGPGDMKIEEIKRPKTGPDGIILKVKACGVCPIMDIDPWLRYKENGMGIGLALGHEWSGEIVEIGSQVTKFQVGDRIHMEPIYRPCYTCDACRQKDFWRCANWVQGIEINGGFAEYLWIPFITDESAMKFPETMSFLDLALMEPLALSVGVARKVKSAEVVVVFGQELMGLGIVAVLKKMGIKKVITCDISEKRLEASTNVGADIAVNSLEEDIVKVVMRETDGEGADYVIQADHRPIAIMQAISSVKRTGQILLAGTYGNPLTINPCVGSGVRHAIGPEWHGYIEQPLAFDSSLLNMRVAWGTMGPRKQRWVEVLDLIQSGTITAEKHVTHVLPLDRINEAFNIALKSKDAIKVMVEP